MTDVEKAEKADKKVYEVGFLLIPKLTEEEVPAAYGNIKEAVAKAEGEVISEEAPKLITLAYSMSKVISNVRQNFNTAHFGWVKFYMDAEKVGELEKTLTLDSNILRFLIIKTVKENTLSSKRFVSREGMRRRPNLVTPHKEEAPAEPINKEVLDKEIEALVAAE